MADSFSATITAGTWAGSNAWVCLRDKDGVAVVGGDLGLELYNYDTASRSLELNAPVAVTSISVCSWWNHATLDNFEIQHRVAQATCE